MNFNQDPGIYNATTDKFIMDIPNQFKKSIIAASDVNSFNLSCIKDTFYIILPDDVQIIDSFSFRDNENLIGISGKNVIFALYLSFAYCKNLEVVDFPNLKDCSQAFIDCPGLGKRYKNENNLIVLNNNFLISTSKFKGDKLIIPNNIKYIADEAFRFCKVDEIVFPLKLKSFKVDFRSEYGVYAKKIILPIEFGMYDCDINFDTKLFYKGTKEHFDDIIFNLEKSKEVYDIDNIVEHIIVEPYTFEELLKMNYSISDMEFVLNRKLKLDELLKLDYSIKEANEYFKGSEVER